MGFCQVPNCPRGVKPALVGPCCVCKTCEDLDNHGANLMTFYKTSPGKIESEQRRYDELFVSIVNSEIERDEANLSLLEIEIAPQVDEIFKQGNQQ